MTVDSQEISLHGLDALQDVEAVCLWVAHDERPLRGAAGFIDWRLCGALSRHLKTGFFEGKEGEQLLVPTQTRTAFPRLFVLGLGRNRAPNAVELAQTLSKAAHMLERAKMSKVAVEMPLSLQSEQAEEAEKAFLKAFRGERVVWLKAPVSPSKVASN